MSQSAKQSSIERQQRMELQVKQDALDYQKEQDRKAEADKSFNQLMISSCIEAAEDSYWDFMELNGTGKRNDPKGVTAATRFWDDAKEDKADAIDNCYRKYGN
ncbi:MAG: hypothetical protein EOL98_15395 [Negativicutes bacterium]|nr:hypothetical protein [Negativicutes bacterium]